MRSREPSYIWGRGRKHSYLPHRLSPVGAMCRQQLRNASSQIIGAPLGMTQGYEYTDGMSDCPLHLRAPSRK
eukprot:6810998-Pyramimonas_sp.AAC.1